MILQYQVFCHVHFTIKRNGFVLFFSFFIVIIFTMTCISKKSYTYNEGHTDEKLLSFSILTFSCFWSGNLITPKVPLLSNEIIFEAIDFLWAHWMGVRTINVANAMTSCRDLKYKHCMLKSSGTWKVYCTWKYWSLENLIVSLWNNHVSKVHMIENKINIRVVDLLYANSQHTFLCLLTSYHQYFARVHRKAYITTQWHLIQNITKQFCETAHTCWLLCTKHYFQFGFTDFLHLSRSVFGRFPFRKTCLLKWGQFVNLGLFYYFFWFIIIIIISLPFMFEFECSVTMRSIFK